ncbi:auxin efflux carrier [Panus rudis PR-1116 ss-1]|nr:auxin efflux carrier [Panus rudis PR-1116 ss-1]
MLSPGFLIFSGTIPVLKTYITIAVGYILARNGYFPPAAIKGASYIFMNVSLPLVIFGSIIPALSTKNASAIGPLFMTAFTYILLGLLFGLIIREICYVPRNFWQGILIVSCLSNWSSLPNAVVHSVTQQAPFDPSIDPDLGVSYVAIFIVSYHIVFFVLGAAHTLAWDYLPDVPQGEDAEVRVKWYQKPIGSRIAKHVLGRQVPPALWRAQGVRRREDAEESPGGIELREREQQKVPESMLESTQNDTVGEQSDSGRPAQKTDYPEQISAQAGSSRISTPAPPSRHRRLHIPPVTRRRLLKPLHLFLTPVTVSLLVSLPISMVRPLKGLFVDESNAGGPTWKAPDGRPPLAFLLDTAQFIGNIAIPLALILLGSSFARLHIPRPLSRLPIMAMLAVAFAKMVLLPVIGVFMTKGMVSGGLIQEDAKVQKFVTMFLSGSPAAINQLIVASLYSPHANVDTLAVSILYQILASIPSSHS